LGVHGGGSGLSLFRPRALTPPPSTPPSLSSRTQWTVINAAGVKSTLLSDKRGIISRFKLGVPIRDMRLMDGGLFAPDAAVILVRDNAIVMRIEHVRLIATASEVLISQDGASGDAAGARFGAALLEAILDAAADGRAQTAREGESEATMMGAGGERGTWGGGRRSPRRDADPPASSPAPAHEPDPLPFELHVLETALRDVTASSALAVKELDAVATPALDALTRSVTTLNLERVRKIKTRHQRLLTRVQSLREELQGFLDDDADMFRMCLTRRAEAERGGPALRADLPPLATPGAGADFVGSLRSSGFTRRSSLNMGGGRLTPGPGVGTADGGPDDDTAASADADALETVENLLESYFMQVDASYDRMISMDEYIKDTEVRGRRGGGKQNASPQPAPQPSPSPRLLLPSGVHQHRARLVPQPPHPAGDRGHGGNFRARHLVARRRHPRRKPRDPPRRHQIRDRLRRHQWGRPDAGHVGVWGDHRLHQVHALDLKKKRMRKRGRRAAVWVSRGCARGRRVDRDRVTWIVARAGGAAAVARVFGRRQARGARWHARAAAAPRGLPGRSPQGERERRGERV